MTDEYISEMNKDAYILYRCHHPDTRFAHSFFLFLYSGVDEDLIIDILTKRTYSQRREIAFEYEKKAKKVLCNTNFHLWRQPNK